MCTYIHTSTAESRDAMARISAHETVLGQAFSRAALMRSITSKPLAELRLPFEYFSEMKVVELSNRIDASHPCPNPQIVFLFVSQAMAAELTAH